MKAIPISRVRQMGEAVGGRRVVVIVIDGPDYCITTWGKTVRDCRSLAEWAESDAATRVVRALAGEKPESACISVACVPGVADE